MYLDESQMKTYLLKKVFTISRSIKSYDLLNFILVYNPNFIKFDY